MNLVQAFNQFKKEHPVLIHVYLAIFLQAVVPGFITVYSYLLHPSQMPFATILESSAAMALASLIHGIFGQVESDPTIQKNDPMLAMALQMVQPVVDQAMQRWTATFPLASVAAQQVPAQQPVAQQAPVPTYTSSSVGNQIADALIKSVPDFTLTPTTTIPAVSFPQPAQAPVQPASAFHELLQTQAAPVPPVASSQQSVQAQSAAAPAVSVQPPAQSAADSGFPAWLTGTQVNS